MDVLVFASTGGETVRRLREVIDRVPMLGRVPVCYTINELSRRLCEPAGNSTIVVLLAATVEDLLGLVSLRDLLLSVRTIFILPNREGATIARAHTLRPRFLSYVDSNFEEIGAVLGKMLADGEQGRARAQGPDA